MIYWYIKINCVFYVDLILPVRKLHSLYVKHSFIGEIHPSAPHFAKSTSILFKHYSISLWGWRHIKWQNLSSPLDGDVILRTWVPDSQENRKQTWSLTPQTILSLTLSFLFQAIHNVWSCVYTIVHSCVSISVSCWPSWVCRSCERLLLSVLRHCVPLLQSCGPAWVRRLGDPAGHWTNSGALPPWFRPPQTLPIAGAPWQPDDGHSAKFPTQSSSGKLATQHWADQHTGSELCDVPELPWYLPVFEKHYPGCLLSCACASLEPATPATSCAGSPHLHYHGY